MLQLPNLDDRTFLQIVEEARKKIPTLTDEWTDENAHDPGITLIELFSWLTEAQQYHIDQITEKNELKFLKLLGIFPKPAQPSTVELSFFIQEGYQKKVFLPKGTQISARGQVFETMKEQWILPHQLEKVFVMANGETVDFSMANESVGPTYYAFGQRAEQGSRFYLAFDQELPINEEFSLACSLFEDDPIFGRMDKDIEKSVIPSAKVSWYYYGEDSSQLGSWLPLEIKKDETLHLSYSGYITMRIPTPMIATTVHPATDRRRFWVYCQLDLEGYELPPKVDKLHLNSVKAEQCQTFCHDQVFSSNGSKHQQFILKRYLDLFGHLLVQVYEDELGGWKDWTEIDDFAQAAEEDCVYRIIRDARAEQVTVLFGDGERGKIPSFGSKRIRVVSYSRSLEKARWLGRSNGLPFQAFELPIDLKAQYLQQVQIQVGVREQYSEEWIWQDWERVADFDRSSSEDLHYVVDLETNTIRFGNHEQGRVPPISKIDHIRILSLQYGGGEGGNVKSHVIQQILLPEEAIESDLQKLVVTNFYDATGGIERESLEEAKARLLSSLNHPTRTVTNMDFEAIAKATPGLRVARAKSIPLYVPHLKEYPKQKAHGQISVVIVPYSERTRPIPSAGFLQTVKNHLDQYRLITTEIHVIPPKYIKVTVYATVVVEPEMKNNERIIDALNRFLHPLESQGRQGWDFGRSVFKGDIMAEINRVPGVLHIQDLWLNGEGQVGQTSGKGEISIPPHGLVYSGKHEVSLISRLDL